MKKIVFTEDEIKNIVFEYVENKLSCMEIAKRYGVSDTPIKKILKEKNILRKGKSNGIKIILNKKQEDLIKNLYIKELRGPKEISEITNLNYNFIKKHIYLKGYSRTLGESISVRQKGKKRSLKVRKILSIAQQKYSKSGERKQTGGVCKFYNINGLQCQGTYEKFYIENLIKNKKKLPKNGTPIKTPYGVYYPDFSYDEKHIEIKSEYTYKVLIGEEINRWTNKYDTTQYDKIKWVNENIKPVDILVVDNKKVKIK